LEAALTWTALENSVGDNRRTANQTAWILKGIGERPPTGESVLRQGFVKLVPLLTATVLVTTGCDPIVNFYGSFFPAWVVCVVLGLFLASLLRWLFAVTRIERHLGPLVLIYPALAFLLTCVSWLVLFGP
jgi:hypothetical protein